MPRKLHNILLICVVAIVTAAAIYGAWRWLGWYIDPQSPTHRKDHVQVLAVGLGAVGAIITAIIGWRNLKQSQRSTEKTLENTRDIEEERAQNDALQKYFELMGQLLTKEKLRSPVDVVDDVRILAQAQTLTALKSLGPDRKLILLNFLHKAKLIEKENPIVSLDMAHLGAADLSEASLIKANLSGAYLREANLSDADLTGAGLSFANLSGATLIKTRLEGADLELAKLEASDLTNASLGKAFLLGANLRGANLSSAHLPEANLNGVDLRDANLSGAMLQKATLRNVDLRGANINAQQLRQCKSLKGATMPDGSKHD